MAVNTCVKNMESISLLLVPLPSDLLLQGGRVSSHSSSELSFLGGCLASEKMRESEGKREKVGTATSFRPKLQ